MEHILIQYPALKRIIETKENIYKNLKIIREPKTQIDYNVNKVKDKCEIYIIKVKIPTFTVTTNAAILIIIKNQKIESTYEIPLNPNDDSYRFADKLLFEYILRLESRNIMYFDQHELILLGINDSLNRNHVFPLQITEIIKETIIPQPQPMTLEDYIQQYKKTHTLLPTITHGKGTNFPDKHLHETWLVHIKGTLVHPEFEDAIIFYDPKKEIELLYEYSTGNRYLTTLNKPTPSNKEIEEAIQHLKERPLFPRNNFLSREHIWHITLSDKQLLFRISNINIYPFIPKEDEK